MCVRASQRRPHAQASLGELHALRSLNVSHNAILGTLPPSMGAMSSLEVLSLAHNRLQGALPPALLLSPPADGNNASAAPALRLLDVAHNRLSGTLPVDAIAQHTSLMVLDVSHNAGLRGHVPLPPPSARVWVCAGNAFTGSLTHASVVRAPLLRHLDVSANVLQGPLPTAALLQLPRLQHLNASRNARVYGHLPCGSGNATVDNAQRAAVFGGAWAQLEVLDVGHMSLNGTLCPALFHAGAALTHFAAPHNTLSGAFPGEALSQVPRLIHLDVSHNGGITGTLHASLGNLAGLTWFSVAGNALHGKLPLALTTLPALHHLGISANPGLSWEFV